MVSILPLISNSSSLFKTVSTALTTIEITLIFIILTTPSARAGYDIRSIFKWSLTGFPSPRLVASPRLKNLVCPTILPIAGERIIGFIPFPRVLVLCEMQSVSSRIWTCVAVSISYDDNHYTMGTLIFMHHSFFSSRSRFKYLSIFCSLLFSLYVVDWIVWVFMPAVTGSLHRSLSNSSSQWVNVVYMGFHKSIEVVPKINLQQEKKIVLMKQNNLDGWKL